MYLHFALKALLENHIVNCSQKENKNIASIKPEDAVYLLQVYNVYKNS